MVRCGRQRHTSTMADTPEFDPPPSSVQVQDGDHYATTGPPVRRGLARSAEHNLIAGVAGGLAATWGWKPWLVRLLFLVATPLAGLGVVLYLLGWLLIPLEGTSRSIAAGIAAGLGVRRRWVGLGAVILGGLIVGRVANLDLGVLIAGALIVTGYLLYRGDLQMSEDAEPEPPDYVFGIGSRSRPLRPPSYLGRLTIGVLITTLGVMAGLDAAGIAFPTSRHYAAAAVLVVGGGLLVGSVYGRGRGLIVLGLLLLPILVVAAVADHRFGSSWEYVTVRPATLDGVGSEYRIAAGAITIDLSRVDFEGRAIELDLESGIGDVYVQLPPDVSLEAAGNAIYGNVAIEDRYSSGIGANVVHSLPGAAGTVRLDADVRIGNISVYRFAEPEPVPPVEGLFGQPELGTVRADSYVETSGLTYIEPRSLRQLAGTYNVLGGQLVLDLTGIRNDSAAVGFTITGHGAARVIVSPHARVLAASSIPFTDDPEGLPSASDLYLWEKDGTGPTWVINAEGVHVLIEEG